MPRGPQRPYLTTPAGTTLDRTAFNRGVWKRDRTRRAIDHAFADDPQAPDGLKTA
ncbi:hypothetical protein K7640_29220 [Micromonospora sp. PLK6-60]|uniref:hypothetical protein n=1 Tax=Micromonospora sp. PLK6-60 TaxID=2873383 RepID=UPI001CA737CA|nr:hypothetical protein [Micromonospora sp. PLK6-60]MBY8875917.1 hypothetical protein [Micromonospora sp. PLK6-60]